jgi:hypothetical protein
VKAIDQGQEIQIDKVVSPTVASGKVTESNFPKLPTEDAAPVSPAYALLSPIFPASGESSPS